MQRAAFSFSSSALEGHEFTRAAKTPTCDRLQPLRAAWPSVSEETGNVPSVPAFPNSPEDASR